MVKLIAGQPKILRDINEINILHLIREEGPISRIDISKKIGISQTAVSRIVARLIENNYVSEVTDNNCKRSVGRQPISLQFNHSIGNVIAIDLGRVNSLIALVNLGGEIIHQEPFASELQPHRDVVLEKLSARIVAFLSKHGFDLSEIYGIGITIPGIVTSPEGIIRSFGRRHEWIGFHLRQYFEKKFGILTCIETDTRAITYAEYHMGHGKTSNNMVCLCVTEVGPYAGIIHNGELIRGITDCAGEVGTIQVGYYIQESNLFRSLFKEQKNVLFDEVMQPNTILDIARREINNGLAIAGPQGKISAENLTVLDVVRAAEKGDQFCQSVLKEFATILGALCLNIVNLYNPELIILNGEIFWEGSFIQNTMQAMVKKHILPISVEPVRFISSKFKEDRHILGVTSIVLSKLFHPPKFDKDGLSSFCKRNHNVDS